MTGAAFQAPVVGDVSQDVVEITTGLAVEDQRAVGVAACPPARQGLGNGV